jgi:DNA-binding XRE family transcriptional regulator
MLSFYFLLRRVACGAKIAIPQREKNAAVDIAARFGDSLARARLAADITQEELSIRAGLHRTEVSQLERGLRVPRIDTLIKLADSLEVAPAELLVGIHWTPGGTRHGSFSDQPDDEGQAGSSVAPTSSE